MSTYTQNKNISQAAKLAAKNKASAEAYEMLFGTQSYSDERKQRWQRQHLQQDVRTNGFDLLSNKDEMATRLRKTRVCRNLEKFGKCNRKVCYFAHSSEELKDPECVFGLGCRKRKTCTHKHDDETSEEYRTRRGIKFPEVKVEDKENKEDVDTAYSELVRTVLRDEGSKTLKIETPKAPPPSPVIEDETVLIVPPELAEEAMKLAISSGKTNIRVELITNA